MRSTLIQFLDELREYIAESDTNIADDERESSEIVDVFLNKAMGYAELKNKHKNNKLEWKR